MNGEPRLHAATQKSFIQERFYTMAIPFEGKKTTIIIKHDTGYGDYLNEGVRATYLGKDLFRIEAPSMFSTEPSRMDIVRCKIIDEHTKPVLIEVVVSQGHRSIDVSFVEGMAKEDIKKFFDDLGFDGIAYFPCLFGHTITVAPEVGVQTIKKILSESSLVTDFRVRMPDGMH